MIFNPDQKHIARIRSAGFFTKGLVYVFIGILTIMAAFHQGGDITSTRGAINYLVTMPLGKLLGGAVALGLFAYCLWRFYQMVALPGKENDKHENFKKGAIRLRYFYSGIFYGIIAYSFARPLVAYLSTSESATENSENGEDEKAALWELLSHDWGKGVIWILAAVVAGQAIWQFKLAYSANFMKKIDNYPSIKNEYDFIRKSGRLGYAARGVVFAIISFFLVQVILQHNANVYKGTEDALQYLLSFSYGSLLLGATALGLIGYGIFNLMVARHADLTNIS